MAVFATEARTARMNTQLTSSFLKSEIFTGEIVFLANVLFGSSAFAHS